MAQQQAGTGKGGGTHSRTPRKRTRTTLRAGGMHSRTTAGGGKAGKWLAQLRRLHRKIGPGVPPDLYFDAAGRHELQPDGTYLVTPW